MAELLKIVYRGQHCPAEREVGGTALTDNGEGHQETGMLLCGLEPGHIGPLHYDSADRIWWSADA